MGKILEAQIGFGGFEMFDKDTQWLIRQVGADTTVWGLAVLSHAELESLRDQVEQEYINRKIPSSADNDSS